MQQDLYMQLKLFLSNYPFNDDDNFYTLHKAFTPHMNRRQFVLYMKNMGVRSVVRRVDGRVSRHLEYDPKQDKYLLDLFPVLGVCPTCEGKGVVSVSVK